ncbi:MAG: hypothetical protein RR728_05805, partial [Oscillospiraceae bacterium]
MKHKKQSGRMARRILAFAMTACLVATSFSPIVSVQAEGSPQGTVSLCGFAELPNEIKTQSIPLGVSQEKLNLPSTLEAVANSVLDNTEPALPTEPDKPTTDVPTPSEPTPDVATPSEPTPDVPTPSEATPDVPTPSEATPSEATPDVSTPSEPTPSEATPDVPTPSEPTPSEATPDVPTPSEPTPDVTKPDIPSTEPVTIHSVTWESSPLYDENVVGEYIFTATLPQPYVLAEGVALPKISITVYGDKTASKIVTSWQWDDPNGYISEGVLELPGVSKENPINLDALVSMLPTSILATLNASEPSNTSTPS